MEVVTASRGHYYSHFRIGVCGGLHVWCSNELNLQLCLLRVLPDQGRHLRGEKSLQPTMKL